MYKFGLAIAALSMLVLASCTTSTESERKVLQLVLPDQPTASVTIRNPNEFTIGIVAFQECETLEYATPEPQVIEPGQSATYEVAPRCYEIIAGEAGLSTKFAVRTTRQINAGDVLVLP